MWRDDRAVAFMTIAPIRPGHSLVVPIVEVDHWIDLDGDLAAHLMVVSRHIGRAQMAAFQPNRIGMIIAGLEVPHTHLHVIPIGSESDLDFAKAEPGTPGEEIEGAAERLRAALRDAGHSEVSS